MSEQTHNSMLPSGFLLAGRYRIDKYLSSGGCGNTYLVTDMKFASSRTRVVIKEFFLAERTYRSSGSSRVVVTNPDNQALVTKLREKFKREAKLIFSLKHPNIVSVSDYFDANDTSYYVMQYVEGGSLAKKLEDEGPLAEEDALRYIRQVLSALYVMHAEGLYHLDLKPANIMLDAYDNAKLIDFGASKIADDDSGKFSTTTPLYTRGFAPTEQVEGVLSRLGAWTDIYAVGATLYNLLSGMAPPMPSEILERGEEALTLPDDVSQRTKKAIAAFMQQNMRQRPQNVEEAEVLLFGKAQKHIKAIPEDNTDGENFETQLPDAPKDATRHDLPVQNEKGNHNNKWLYGIIAFFLAVIAGGGYWYYSYLKEDQEVRQLVELFTKAVETGDSLTILTNYPDAKGADSLYIPNSKYMISQMSESSNYKVEWNKDIWMEISPMEKEGWKIISSQGLFAWSKDEMEFAKRTGQWKPGLTDKDLSVRMDDHEFKHKLIDEFCNNLKKRVIQKGSLQVLKEAQSEMDKWELGVTVANNNEFHLSGNDYQMTIKVWDQYLYNNNLNENEAVFTVNIKGQDIAPYSEIVLSHFLEGWQRVENKSIQIIWNVNNQQLFNKYFVATGDEYEHYLKSIK